MTLEEIRNNIEGDSEDKRFEAWAGLYTGTSDGEKSEMERILSGTDPVLKVLLARFLAKIFEERAVVYICRLLCDSNPVVLDVGLRAFEKNLFEAKLPKLLSVIDAPQLKARKFAIEKLCLGNIPEAVGHILHLLKTAQGELLEHILVCVRHVPDRRFIDIMKVLIGHTSHDIRFHAIMVMGALYEAGYRQCMRYLVKGLSDPNPRVRQAILWQLRRVAERRHLRHFLKFSKDDPDARVRQEAILGLSDFPLRRVVHHLLKLLVSDPDRMVVLKGEAVLLSISQKKLIRGLKKVLHDREFAVRSKAVVLLSEFHPDLSHDYYRFLMREIKKAKNTKEKIPFVQSLGIVGYEEALPYLEKEIRSGADDMVLAYVALVALVRVYAKSGNFPVLKLLKDDSLSDLLKQMAMKTFVKQADPGQYTEDLMLFLIGYLKSERINLRFLAARVLIASEDDRFLKPLFDMILSETDPSIRQLLKEYVIQVISKSPALFLHMAGMFCEKPAFMKTLFEFYHEVIWDREKSLLFLDELMKPQNMALLKRFAEPFSEILLSLARLKLLEWYEVIDVLDKIQQSGSIVECLIAKMKSRGDVISVSREDWKRWLYRPVMIHPESVIRLMALCQDRAVLTILVEIMTNPERVVWHAGVREVIQERMRLIA